MTNKNVLMVVAPQDFRDEEYLEPRQVLEAAGIGVKVASLKLGEAAGVNGALVPIDLLVSEAKPEDFEGVIFVGGQGMVGLVNDERLTSLARHFYNAHKLTCAICIAPMVLANAGLLKGKRATVWSGAQDGLVKAGALYTGQAVEIDGKIITANGPGAAREFGEKVVELLKN